MNKVELMGRLTRDPDVRWSQGQEQKCVARYTLAVNRRVKAQDGTIPADFISCVAFGKAGEFAEKYLKKGVKICVVGRIQTGKYTNKNGETVYTTDVVIEEQEFAEAKRQQDGSGQQGTGAGQQDIPEDWYNVPEGTEEELPFQ